VIEFREFFSVSICVSILFPMRFRNFGLEGFRSIFGSCLVRCTTRAFVVNMERVPAIQFQYFERCLHGKITQGISKILFYSTNPKFESINDIWFIIWEIYDKFIQNKGEDSGRFPVYHTLKQISVSANKISGLNSWSWTYTNLAWFRLRFLFENVRLNPLEYVYAFHIAFQHQWNLA